MSHTVKHLFVVPGDQLAWDNSDLLLLLHQHQLTWDNFVNVALVSLIEQVCRGQMDDDPMTKLTVTDVEEYIHEVLSGLDIVEVDKDYLAFYDIIAKATTELLNLAREYIFRILSNLNHYPPNSLFAFELNIERTVGYDIVFCVHYTIKDSP